MCLSRCCLIRMMMPGLPPASSSSTWWPLCFQFHATMGLASGHERMLVGIFVEVNCPHTFVLQIERQSLVFGSLNDWYLIPRLKESHRSSHSICIYSIRVYCIDVLDVLNELRRILHFYTCRIMQTCVFAAPFSTDPPHPCIVGAQEMFSNNSEDWAKPEGSIG